jgi:hypothetical protein
MKLTKITSRLYELMKVTRYFPLFTTEVQETRYIYVFVAKRKE